MKIKGMFFIMLFGFSIIITVSCKKSSSTDTSSGPTVTDIDGNVYHTVVIGTQTWMIENLKVKHYRNGDPIPDGTAILKMPAGIGPDTTGYIYAYDNSQANAAVYGYLYNWYAVKDSRNVAPIGWHVPSDAEYTALVDKLGGDYLLLPNGDTTVGGEMKETGTVHWGVQGLPNSNFGATNISGWTGLPGGFLYQGVFNGMRGGGVWWTTTTLTGANPLNEAYALFLVNYNKNATRGSSFKPDACSIRCLNDKSK
jgi:uncharacterized protein (TIGR02145 family)